MNRRQILSEKINLCLGVSIGLKKLLYSLLENKTISDKDFNCILSLAECLENSLENLSKEFNS